VLETVESGLLADEEADDNADGDVSQHEPLTTDAGICSAY